MHAVRHNGKSRTFPFLQTLPYSEQRFVMRPNEAILVSSALLPCSSRALMFRNLLSEAEADGDEILFPHVVLCEKRGSGLESVIFAARRPIALHCCVIKINELPHQQWHV